MKSIDYRRPVQGRAMPISIIVRVCSNASDANVRYELFQSIQIVGFYYFVLKCFTRWETNFSSRFFLIGWISQSHDQLVLLNKKKCVQAVLYIIRYNMQVVKSIDRVRDWAVGNHILFFKWIIFMQI